MYRISYSRVHTLRSDVYLSICDTINSPKIHKQGDIVNNLNNWQTGEFILAYYERVQWDIDSIKYFYNGIWDGVTEKYLATRIDNGSTDILGWILTSIQKNSITLHEYAYK